MQILDDMTNASYDDLLTCCNVLRVEEGMLVNKRIKSVDEDKALRAVRADLRSLRRLLKRHPHRPIQQTLF